MRVERSDAGRRMPRGTERAIALGTDRAFHGGVAAPAPVATHAQPSPAPAPPAVVLRSYQQDGIARMRARVAAGARRVLACGPTGMGKTLLAAAIIVGAVRKGKRALFLAHRRELIEQCYAKLRASGLDDAHLGVVLAGDKRRRPNAPVQIASVQTLVGCAKPPADLIFADEAHHANSTSWQRILARYPDAAVIGLTATPCRADGRGLGDVFAELVQIVSFKQLVDEGFLVAPRVFTSRSPLDLSAVKTTGGDYNLGQLGATMNKRELVGDIVTHWQRIAEGRSTIAFASSVEHSRAIVERFRAVGVAAEHVDGETPVVEREAILARLASGETQVVSNMGVLTEGFDCPRVKCIILARPTKSLSLFLQCAGRGLRPWNDVSAILLDHAGCVLTHGFPQDDREWSLEGKARRAKAPAVKTCPTCFAALPSGTLTCTECGHCFERPEREGLKQRDGDLIEVAPPSQIPTATRREWYRAALAEAAKSGRKLGWARHRFRERFARWPSGFQHIEREFFIPIFVGPVFAKKTPTPVQPKRPVKGPAPTAAIGGTQPAVVVAQPSAVIVAQPNATLAPAPPSASTEALPGGGAPTVGAPISSAARIPLPSLASLGIERAARPRARRINLDEPQPTAPEVEQWSL